MAILTLDQVLKAEDSTTKTIETPGWPDADGNPGELVIRSLTKWQHKDIRERSKVPDEQGYQVVDDDLMDLHIIIEGVVEPAGLTAEHIGVLKGRDAAQINAVVREIMALNAMEKGAVADRQKAFPARPGAAVPVPPVEEHLSDAGGDAPAPADV